MQCENNLRQLGIALHLHHQARSQFPPGMTTSDNDLSNGECTGFTHLLPFFEQTAIHDLYDFSQPWHHTANYEPVGMPIKLLLCPSNPGTRPMDLTPYIVQWSCPLPPLAATTDYAFCKGANASLTKDPTGIPGQARGVFDVNSGTRLEEMRDGTSSTIAVGDAAAGARFIACGI